MGFQCPLCLLDPLSHSLIKLKEINDVIYFYTCPSQAKLYFDVDSIIKHYDGVLSEIPTNKKWIWIFDSYNFNFKHFIQINVGIELAKLISSKFSSNLNQIIIINPTFYTSSTYNIIYPFLNEKLRHIIQFNSQYKSSDEILENL
jgi:hypothetical protein